VGEAVGGDVGDMVGSAEGTAVGEAVGEDEGEFVGDRRPGRLLAQHAHPFGPVSGAGASELSPPPHDVSPLPHE